MNYNGAMNFKWENVSLVAGSPFCLSACPSSVFFFGWNLLAYAEPTFAGKMCVRTIQASTRNPRSDSELQKSRAKSRRRQDFKICNYCIVNVVFLFPFTSRFTFSGRRILIFFPFSLSLLETQTRHVMDCTILFLK